MYITYIYIYINLFFYRASPSLRNRAIMIENATCSLLVDFSGGFFLDLLPEFLLALKNRGQKVPLNMILK